MGDPVYDFLSKEGASAQESTSGDPVHDFLDSGKIPESISKAPSVKSTDNSYAFPDTTLGRAATGLAGEAKGAFDMLVEGPAQFLGHAVADIYPKKMPGYEFFQRQKDIGEEGRKAREEGFKNLTRNTETSAAIGEGAGNIVGALALPQSKAAEGANLINRMIAAGKTGAVIGAATPVSDEDHFWRDKTFQVGASAVVSALMQPVSEGVAKGIGYIGDKIKSWAANGKTDQMVEKIIQNATPDLKESVINKIKSGQDINSEALGRQVRADSLPIKIRLTEGQALQDPVIISQEMNTRSKNNAIVYHLQDQNNYLIQNLNHIRDTGAPEAAVTDHITAGDNLIKAGQEIIDKKSAETSALYKKLTEANGGDLPMDGKAFVENAEAALKKQMKAPFLPSEVKSILESIKIGENPMTFENFENLRTILASSSRAAERSGNGNTVAAIRSVRDALENIPVNSEVQGVKELADAARKSAKEGFDMLRDVPALKAIDSGKAADNNFIQKYIVGASKKDLEGLANVLQDNPVALQTIKAGTINYLKNSAGVISDSGNFSQHGYNKALQSLGPKLDVIFGPEESAVLKNVGSVAKDIQLAPKGAFVNTSNTDVANLARQGAASAVDRITGLPIGSVTKHAFESAMQQKVNATKIANMIGPGAGVGRKAANEFMDQKLPKIIGQGAVIPISTFMSNIKNRSDEKSKRD